MRKMTLKVNVEATVTVNADDDVTVQHIQDSFSYNAVEHWQFGHSFHFDVEDSEITGLDITIEDSR